MDQLKSSFIIAFFKRPFLMHSPTFHMVRLS